MSQVSFASAASAPAVAEKPVIRVAATVLNWRGAADTIGCIESLLRLEQDIGIFLLDNASGDGSTVRFREWASRRLPELNAQRLGHGRPAVLFRECHATEPGEVANWQPSVTLMQTGLNRGYAAGNNVGIRRALDEGYDYVWILNNDTEVAPDALTWLLQRMDENPEVGICGSTLVYFDGRHRLQCQGGSRFSRLKGRGVPLGSGYSVSNPMPADKVEAQIDYVSGASALVRRRFLEEVGLMQEKYFLYWEELDWAMRARGRFKLGYAAKSTVYHKLGATIGTRDVGPSSVVSEYYMTRNRIRVCWRYSLISLPFVFADTARNVMRWAAKGRLDRAAVLVRAALGLPLPMPSRASQA